MLFDWAGELAVQDLRPLLTFDRDGREHGVGFEIDAVDAQAVSQVFAEGKILDGDRFLVIVLILLIR